MRRQCRVEQHHHNAGQREDNLGKDAEEILVIQKET
jgi:hypothetical protein